MKLFTTLAAATLAAPLLATPAQAADINNFVAARATSICFVATGKATMDQTLAFEMLALTKSGMTLDQYQIFNEQSDHGELVGNMIYEKIKSLGGCEKWMREPAPAPTRTVPARNGYNL